MVEVGVWWPSVLESEEEVGAKRKNGVGSVHIGGGGGGLACQSCVGGGGVLSSTAAVKVVFTMADSRGGGTGTHSSGVP